MATIKHRFQSLVANTVSSKVSSDRWNDSLVIAGGTDTGVLFRDSGAADGWSIATGLLWNDTTYTMTVASGITFAAGTITDTKPFKITQTWNDATEAFTALLVDITSTAADAASLAANLKVGGSSIWSVRKDGLVQFAHGTAAAPAVAFGTTTVGFKSGNETYANNNAVVFVGGNADIVQFTSNRGIAIKTGWFLEWGIAGAVGPLLYDVTTTTLGIRSAATTTGCAFEFLEMTAPAAGAANTARIYAVDNGAGKTQVMAIFSDSSTAQICIQP